MGGDSGVEVRRDCAVEHGRRRRKLMGESEQRRDSAEEMGRRDLFGGKAQGYRERRNARRVGVGESRFMRQQ